MNKKQIRNEFKKAGEKYFKDKNLMMQWHNWVSKASLNALEKTTKVFYLLSMGKLEDAIEEISTSRKQEDLIASLTAICFIYKSDEFRRSWNKTFPETGRDFPGFVMVNSGLALSLSGS